MKAAIEVAGKKRLRAKTIFVLAVTAITICLAVTL
jgi:hypothetical protein